MTQSAVATTIHSNASINIGTVVLPRARWNRAPTPDGRIAYEPIKGTWYGQVIRGRERHAVTVIAIISCPSCGKLLMLSHSPDAARGLRAMTGMQVPVAHQIDYQGKVSPDVRCMHKPCEFHRKVYLDRWNKTKPLYAIAYVDLAKGEHGEIEISYCHAIDPKEALFHFQHGRNVRILTLPNGRPAIGPAISFYVDEKTGRITAD
jgi:hypothetical protein